MTPERSSPTTTQLAEHVRALRQHGQRQKYEHDSIGWTARLDTIQAVVLLQASPARRVERGARASADLYAEGLAGVGDLVPPRCHRRRAGLASVRRTHARPAGLMAHLADEASPPGAITQSLRTSSRAYAAPRPARVVPDRRADRGRGSVAAALPGHRAAQLESVVEGVRDLFGDG